MHQSNYTDTLNVFFERLFAVPERLKKYEKTKRYEKLKEYLSKLGEKYINNKMDYLEGIAFPINLQSSIAVKILP